MKRVIVYLCLILAMTLQVGQSLRAAETQILAATYKDGPFMAEMIDAGFLYGDSNYNAIIHASDGNVYYVINSNNKKSGAHMFRYNTKTNDVTLIGDLTEVVGEDRTKGICQGKVHSDFYEKNGNIYFGTHSGAHDYTYPGGHFISYDLKKGEFKDYGIGVQADGLVALTMDVERGRMSAITWPSYMFTYYDINTGEKKIWGKRYSPVELHGQRSLGVDPRTGNVYWHNMDDTVECYTYKTDLIKTLDEPRFDNPMYQVPFGELGYSTRHVWRSIKWSVAMHRFYGIMYNTDWLFSFEPKTGDLEIIDRIAAGPNRKSGDIIYSSLAFELSRDGKTVYYIGHVEVNQPDTTKKVTELHLVTYNIPFRQYIDNGVIELDDGRRPRNCHGLEVGTDGNIYIVCRIPFTDINSEKGQKMLEIATGGQPALAIKRSQNLQEINLIVMKNPLL